MGIILDHRYTVGSEVSDIHSARDRIECHVDGVTTHPDGGGDGAGGSVDHRYDGRSEVSDVNHVGGRVDCYVGQGELPTGMVAVTVLVAPSITDTVLDPSLTT